MGGLCGWLGGGAQDDRDDALQRAAAVLVSVDGAAPRVVTASQGCIAAVGSDDTSAIVESEAAVLALFGHPRLRGRRGPQSLASVGRELLDALPRRGPAALSELTGDFAVALNERRTGRGMIAVDRFAARNLFYQIRDGRLAFGSTLDTLAVAPGATLELDLQALYDYIFFHVVPGPQTIYRGARRVEPGHCVQFDGSGKIETHAFSPVNFVEDKYAPLPELKARFREVLREATAACADGSACGTFLSGGTDSSTLSGLLGEIKGQPADTFSIGFAAAGFDEMEYARIAARKFGTKHHEYYVTPEDVVAAVPRIATTYDQPFGNASAVPTYYCARFARENGIARMIAGDGGDELFGGNARYAKQQIFAYYEKLPSGVRSHLIEPLLLGPGATRSIPLVRKARRYVEQAIVPMPQRYETGNHVDYIGAEQIFEPDFLHSVDRGHPHALMLDAFAPYKDRSLVNQMLGIDFRFILADGDLPKVTRMCELAGVDVAFPMLDEEVFDFSAQLPPDFKLRGTQLRWFFKEALRDFLPPEIITKKKHGFGLPVGVWLTSHKPLFDLAHSSLQRLRTRGIVQPKFLDRLGTDLLQEHAGFYGVMIWVLMMLSLWLDSRRL